MPYNSRLPDTPIFSTPAIIHTPELRSARSEDDLRSRASSQKLADALGLVRPSLIDDPSNSSPCFFHRRFDDAVNIDRVLEEIAGDETMSHSELVQTATGVREVSRQLQRRPIKRAVRTVLIVTKARDNNLVTLTRELASWLMTTPRYGSSAGVHVYVDDKLRSSKRFNAASLRSPLLHYWTPGLCWSSPDKFDLVLTLGGDGTVLFTSWLFQRVVPPVLSFSLGSLGFLTPFDFENYKDDLNQVMGGIATTSSACSSPKPHDVIADAGMRVNLRMRFTCTVYRSAPDPTAATTGPEEISRFEVLNELVIDRGPSPYISNLLLFGDDAPLTVIQADGVIFSTPTGSTAYSLSAGGSLVHPDIPAILLTPICPHTLSFRPMLLNDTMALRIAVPTNSRATAYCSFDGKSRIELRRGDYVTIAASKYPFPTVVGGRTEWIDSVSRNLRWNTREAQQKGWGGRKSSLRPGIASDIGQLALRQPLPEHGAVVVTDGEETEQEEFDIEIDESDSAAGDSGYGGDVRSDASLVGEDSPMRRNVSAASFWGV